MNKYIDTDKLKDEIERLDDKYRTIRVNGTIQEAKEADLVVHVLHELSNFISRNQEEQSEADFEKEIVRYTRELCYLPITHKVTPMDIMESDWIKCARHFAEWGAIHLNAKKEE